MLLIFSDGTMQDNPDVPMGAATVEYPKGRMLKVATFAHGALCIQYSDLLLRCAIEEGTTRETIAPVTTSTSTRSPPHAHAPPRCLRRYRQPLRE